MSEQTENQILVIAIFVLYGIVGGMEMREQEQLEELQTNVTAQVAPKPKPPTSSPEPQKCKIRTKTDSCIVRLA
jgi:uncharacterized membrane protein affecting hemolysin expression